MYIQRRDVFHLNRGLIDFFLEARLSKEYIEVRAVKLVVTVEMMKSLFLNQTKYQKSEFIFGANKFNKLRDKIKEFFSDLYQLELTNVHKLNALTVNLCTHIISNLYYR